jgi:hypothetical protein
VSRIFREVSRKPPNSRTCDNSSVTSKRAGHANFNTPTVTLTITNMLTQTPLIVFALLAFTSVISQVQAAGICACTCAGKQQPDFEETSSSGCTTSACITEWTDCTSSSTNTASHSDVTYLWNDENAITVSGTDIMASDEFTVTADTCVHYEIMNVDSNGDPTATSNIFTGIITSAEATTIANKIDNSQYANVDAAVTDITGRTIKAADCAFADFSDGWCVKNVRLPAGTYVLGGFNKGTSSVSIGGAVRECTTAEFTTAAVASSAAFTRLATSLTIIAGAAMLLIN